MDTAGFLDLFKQGPQSWNRWREQNPDIRPEIRDATLEDINLRKYDLKNAFF